ncbi:MAG: HisA/HisF-related TIM barrel protein [Buchananella hordeovulneris]|nr:HisA/HisF-related TIM barrel protein [Buchananella hordeovulneris]
MSVSAGMQILPAVDVAAGLALTHRTEQGTSAAGGMDPLRACLQWVEQGADWIHLVDLDAAFGRGENTALLETVVAQLGASHPQVRVQWAGGVVRSEQVERALGAGASRVNLSAKALADWTETGRVLARWAGQVGVCLDVLGQGEAAHVFPRGSYAALGGLTDACERLEALGCQRYVVTDAERDGALRGVNLDLLDQVACLTTGALIASGGVGQPEHVHECRRWRAPARPAPGAPTELSGLIVGKALYTGAVSLPQALTPAAAAHM